MINPENDSHMSGKALVLGLLISNILKYANM